MHRDAHHAGARAGRPGTLAERYATQLSGGQQQRVALARAIVYEPQVVLFDEPLSNLDAKLREQMRIELVRLQRELGITAVYVTHDQSGSHGDVRPDRRHEEGLIEQIGDPHTIYARPANAFVANFIGVANLMQGTPRRDRERRPLPRWRSRSAKAARRCASPRWVARARCKGNR